MDINGARSLITGGASGIGYALAEQLLREGARVVIVDIDEENATAAAARLREATGGEVHHAVADVSDRDSVARVGALVRERFGGLDLLVNNAGVVYHAKPLWETPPEMVDWSFGVNTFGVFNGLQEFLPDMVAQGHGHVVNTASMAGFQVRGNTDWFQGLYCATKFAVVGISEALREDLAPHGIGVSVVAPSAVATNIARSDGVRPDRFGGPTTGSSPEVHIQKLAAGGIEPAVVAALIVDSIRHNRLYVFTHYKDRAVVAARGERILTGFDESQAALDRLGIPESSSIHQPR